MPRTKTGPRPYECVRRAWHSDRHQPIRGSLIKEIFRVANEIHSSSTKQNKEWQEKLPTVVLKAEEIIYSKANSEAEYMDLKTLWDRTNDAINTIIRRDEGSETGEFLQPCIEAALNLGCTPRRASRSQRNCHPRCYLSSNSAGDVDQSVVTNCPNLLRPPKHFGAYPRTTLLAQTNVAAAAPNNAPLSNFVAPDSFAAYPLYYGHVPRFEPIHQGFVLLPKPSVSDAKGHVVPKPQCREDYAVKKIAECKDINLASDPLKIGCDLSLRLAPLSVSVPTPSRHDVSDDILKRRGEFCHRLPVLDKGASFFPQGNTGRGSLFKSAEAEATVRKRKAGFDDQPTAREDRRFCLQPKLPFRHLT